MSPRERLVVLEVEVGDVRPLDGHLRAGEGMTLALQGEMKGNHVEIEGVCLPLDGHLHHVR